MLTADDGDFRCMIEDIKSADIAAAVLAASAAADWLEDHGLPGASVVRSMDDIFRPIRLAIDDMGGVEGNIINLYQVSDRSDACFVDFGNPTISCVPCPGIGEIFALLIAGGHAAAVVLALIRRSFRPLFVDFRKGTQKIIMDDLPF